MNHRKAFSLTLIQIIGSSKDLIHFGPREIIFTKVKHTEKINKKQSDLHYHATDGAESSPCEVICFLGWVRVTMETVSETEMSGTVLHYLCYILHSPQFKDLNTVGILQTCPSQVW